MDRCINGGIYEVDLGGCHDSEFTGEHPSVIIRNLKESEMYYVIPLTSYTKERWDELRKKYCCRIISTNSIARVDKFQVSHESLIPHRYFADYRILHITPDELNAVNLALKKYIGFSIDISEKEYKDYYESYTNFDKHCNRFFNELEFDDFSVFKMGFNQDGIIITCDLSLSGNLVFEDIKDVVYLYSERKSTHVRYNTNSKKIIISLDSNTKTALTIKDKYDTVMALKGN